MPVSTTGKGRLAEDAALSYLQKQGLKIISRNFRSPRGEIDLIMQDGDVIVFVEVRSRKDAGVLNPLESIDETKQRKIVSTSEYFLQKKMKKLDYYCRFDVVTLTGNPDAVNIEWIKNAFDA